MLATACALVLAALVAGAPSRADAADSIGTLGPGRGKTVVFDLVYGNGSGVDSNGKTSRGSQFFLRAEGGGYIKSSSIGNLAGVEFGFQGGYDGVPKRRGRALMAEYGADIGMDLELWLGFPVTLLNLGDGKDDWLRWSVAPGLGTSILNGYFYLKTALAMRLPVVGDSEVAATWWPDAVSNTWSGTNDTRNSMALKFSLFRSGGLHLFVQYQRTQDVTYQAPPRDDPNVYGGLSKPPGMKTEPFPLELRSAADSVVSIGVGFTPKFTRNGK